MTLREILCGMCHWATCEMCMAKEEHKCDKLAQGLKELRALLPVQMADTKIAPLRDKFHYGYNSAVVETNEAFGIEDCTQCGTILYDGKTCEKCEQTEGGD